MRPLVRCKFASLPGTRGGVPTGSGSCQDTPTFMSGAIMRSFVVIMLLLLANPAAAQNPNYYDFEVLPHSPAAGQAFQLRVTLSALSCLRLPESINVTPLAGNVVQIYRRMHNLRAVQLLLGHTNIESTVRDLGVEVDDAIEMAAQTEV